MKLFRVISTLALCTMCAYGFAQPGQLGTQTFNGAYVSYGLTDLGIFRQARVQASTSAAASTRNWEFYEAPADYNPAWRPYVCCPTLTSYNQTINPSVETASARFNLGGGIGGFMQAITAGRYYTFNCTEYSTPGVPVDEYMAVLETSYNPVAITSVTQTPGLAAVYPENSVYVTVTLASAPSAGEYVYVRYSTTFNFLTSSLLPVTITGTTGTVEIPCQSAGTTIYYYAYTSNRTSATILADVVTNGQVAHDMSTLSINNNGGPNYIYTVLPSVGFCGSYYVPSTCYPTIYSFVTALNAGTVFCPVTCYVAAGHTETAPAGGINLTQTGTAVNTITFVRSGVGADPIIYAAVGTVTLTPTSTSADVIFTLNGSDYITIDGIDLVDNNAASPGTMETGYALYKASAANGCQHNVIKNCSISLNASNWYTTGAPLNFELGSAGIMVRNSTRTALTTLLGISSAAGRSDNNEFYGNTISNVINGFVLAGYNDPSSPYTYYDQNNSVGITGAGNTVQNYGYNATTSRASGVYAIYQNNITITDNTFNNITAQNATLYGVFISSPVSGSYGQTMNISNNVISLYMNNTSGNMVGIKTGNFVGATAINITGNTIQNCTFVAGATASFLGIDQEFHASTVTITDNIIQNNTLNTSTGSTSYMIYNTVTSPSVTISGNSILNNHKTVGSTGGHLYGIYGGNTSATGTAVIDNNTISGLTMPTTLNNSFCVGIRLTSAIAQIKTITNNTVEDITGGTSATAISTGILADFMPSGSSVSNNTVDNISSGVAAIGINCSSAAAVTTSSNVSYTVSDNTVSNVFPTSSSGSGIALGGTSASTDIYCTNNSVDNVTCSATIGSINGIRTSGSSAGGNYYIDNNRVSNISHTGTAGCTIAGIYGTASTPTRVSFNSVSDVFGTTSSDFATGIQFNGSGATANIYNNFVQQVYASSSFSNPAANGIAAQATGTYNIYYNTVALGQDGTLTFATNGGASGLYFATGASISLRNNIFYVNANPSGNGVASCLRRISVGTAFTPSTNFLSSSNNNYYYINPDTWNYIYVEGGAGGIGGTIVNGYAWSGATTSGTHNLNNDPCFNVATAGDFASYKYFMSLAGGGSRENSSYYDVPPFAGGVVLPDNIKLTPGATTYAESNASVIGAITTDYEGDARSGSTPDIGADEGAFIQQIASCNLLPIELISFTGWYNGMQNELHWKTATEINSDYFSVEKSLDGISFFSIGEVNAAGNSLVELSYIFYDDDPSPGINYYKLKMVDQNGSFEYSNTIAIRVDEDGMPAFIIYPNPAHETLYLSMASDLEQTVRFEICDIPGRKILNQQVQLYKGQNTSSFDIAHLAAAPYFIYIFSASGEKQVLKFVKE